MLKINKSSHCFTDRVAEFPIGHNNVILNLDNTKLKVLELNEVIAKLISDNLSLYPVTVLTNKNIVLSTNIEWHSVHDLALVTSKNITIKNNIKISNSNNGSLYLKAGMNNPVEGGRIDFEGGKQVYLSGGEAHIHYNPIKKPGSIHKYHNPCSYSKHIEPMKASKAYMLVNNVEDLQNIKLFLHGNYALSSNIDASETKEWNNGEGFYPLTLREENIPFSGNFDGNGFVVHGLTINRPMEHDVGLFGKIAGQEKVPARISNLILDNMSIKGNSYVGGLSGDAEYAVISNVGIASCEISGTRAIGGILGTSKDIVIEHPIIDKPEGISLSGDYKGILLGTGENIKIYSAPALCQEDSIELKCIGDFREQDFPVYYDSN